MLDLIGCMEDLANSAFLLSGYLGISYPIYRMSTILDLLCMAKGKYISFRDRKKNIYIFIYLYLFVYLYLNVYIFIRSKK